MWHARGYGGWGKAEAVVVPGFSHALVTDWNADNRGLHPEREYLAHLAAIQAEWPNATVVVSTFDNFTAQLHASGAVKNLDVITQEIGDSWIYGDPSDARKSAMMRAMHRVWDSHAPPAGVEAGGSADPHVANATLYMLKNIEHTWGEHEHGLDYKAANWTNRAFERLRVDKPGGYEGLEATWWEQRRFGVNATRDALGASHPLGKAVDAELDAYTANCTPPYAQAGVDPASLGWAAVPSHAVATTYLRRGDITVGFDALSGSVARLDARGESWAASGRPLLSLQYVTYSPANFSEYQKGYSGMTKPPGWFVHDVRPPRARPRDLGVVRAPACLPYPCLPP